MTRSYIAVRETILRARGSVVRMVQDENGVVSFEYLIVAACIIAAVGLAFGGTGAGTIKGALSSGISTIATRLTTAAAATHEPKRRLNDKRSRVRSCRCSPCWRVCLSAAAPAFPTTAAIRRTAAAGTISAPRRRSYGLHDRPQVGLALEADTRHVGQGHSAIDHGTIVGKTAERCEDLRIGFVAAAL